VFLPASGSTSWGRFLPGPKCAISGRGGKPVRCRDCFDPSRKLQWSADDYSRSELADWSSRRVTTLVHNRGRSRARGRNPNAGATQRRRGAVAVGVAVLFTGFENAQSQRRPEKPRVASVHLRPRPVALPHLRRPLPVLGDGTQTHRACARRKHAAEHVRILQGRSLAAKENPMILPPRPIVEPEIADLSALNSTTMRSVEVWRACGRASCSPQAGL